MKTRLGGVTILRAGAALALVAALAACGGGSGTTTAGGGGGACDAGETLVGGDCLTAAQVTANTAIDAADTAARALFSAGLVNVTADDITRIDGLVTDAETAIAGLPEDERDAADDGLDEARAILQQARDVLALNNRPQPGNEQVANSGIAVLAAENALRAARKAASDADKAHKLLGAGGTGTETGSELGGTLDLRGESADAEKYAKAILDAAATLEAQEAVADKAVTDIEAARAALPADTPNRADVLESIEDDLTSAQSYQRQILAIDLDGEVYRVQGPKGDRTPKDFADYVAKAIDDAFGAENAGASNAGWLRALPANRIIGTGRIAHTDLLSAPRRKLIEDHGHMKSTAPADFTPLPKPGGRFVLTGAALSHFVDNSSETAEDRVLTSAEVTTAAGRVEVTDEVTPLATSTIDVTYLGLTGDLTCPAAGTCGVRDGVLTGAWYLAQDSDDDTHTDQSGLFRLVDGVWRKFEGGYVEYGYWLQGTDDAPHIVTFADPADRTNSVAHALTLTSADANAPDQAKYSGDAVGISVLRTFNPSNPGEVTSRKSGSFTADVSLTAKFSGTEPELGGRIDNFQGKAVGSGWYVVLDESTIGSAGVLTGESVAVGRTGPGNNQQGAPGRWTAQMTGGSTADPVESPDAVHGGFGAYFPNGAATGAYQAEKD